MYLRHIRSFLTAIFIKIEIKRDQKPLYFNMVYKNVKNIVYSTVQAILYMECCQNANIMYNFESIFIIPISRSNVS